MNLYKNQNMTNSNCVHTSASICLIHEHSAGSSKRRTGTMNAISVDPIFSCRV